MSSTATPMQTNSANRTASRILAGLAGLVGVVILVHMSWMMDSPSQPITLQSQQSSSSTPCHQDSEFPKTAIVLHTIEKSYNTRVKSIRNTWGKRGGDGVVLAFIGDNTTDGNPDMYPGLCPPGRRNVCCKFGYDMLVGWELLSKRPDFEYLLSADDDVYVLPDNLRRVLGSINHEADVAENPNGVMYGIFGCATKVCGGLCGGGGYIMHRYTVEKFVKSFNSTESFLQAFDNNCERCDFWGDMAVSEVAKTVGISFKPYPEATYTWALKEEEINATLNRRRPLSWLYHYPARDRLEEFDRRIDFFGSNEEIPPTDCLIDK